MSVLALEHVAGGGSLEADGALQQVVELFKRNRFRKRHFDRGKKSENFLLSLEINKTQ
jgi:hypothetical protein